MSASASLKLPLNTTSAASTADAARVLNATAGTTAVSVGAGEATFGFEFPGNIDGLVRRLAGLGITAGPMVSISVPVVDLSGRAVNPTQLLADLNASPAVSTAGYDGRTVTASLVAATNAFRYVYEELILNGLMPLDVPTVAGVQEFVL